MRTLPAAAMRRGRRNAVVDASMHVRGVGNVIDASIYVPREYLFSLSNVTVYPSAYV
jgi:hypothetical protein